MTYEEHYQQLCELDGSFKQIASHYCPGEVSQLKEWCDDQLQLGYDNYVVKQDGLGTFILLPVRSAKMIVVEYESLIEDLESGGMDEMLEDRDYCFIPDYIGVDTVIQVSDWSTYDGLNIAWHDLVRPIYRIGLTNRCETLKQVVVHYDSLVRSGNTRPVTYGGTRYSAFYL